MSQIEFNSQLEGIVNCLRFDYYSRRLATAGSDSKIIIFKLSNNSNEFTKECELYDTINGHSQSILDISWSHPKFGNYIASCGYDRKIIIWKETNLLSKTPKWEIDHFYLHNDSVNCCEFFPDQYGLILICGSSDGCLSIHEYRMDILKWDSKNAEIENYNNNNSIINSLSCGPALPPINFQNEDNQNDYDILPLRFCFCTSNGFIYLCTGKNSSNFRFCSRSINKDDNKVNEIYVDILWMKYIGYSNDSIVVSSENGNIYIYKQIDNGDWKIKYVISLKEKGIRLNLSNCGTYLNVCTSTNNIYFYQENLDGEWEEINHNF